MTQPGPPHEIVRRGMAGGVGRLAIIAVALSGCALPTGGSGRTVTVTASAESQWETSVANGVWAGDSPDFPSQIKHWELRSSWSTSTRAFSESWSEVSGEDHEPFPATMNGCDQTKTLVRWRVTSDGQVRGSWRDSSGTSEATGDAASGPTGWMILDGCQTPVFKYIGSGDGSLTDVAISVQQYQPSV